MIRLRGHHWLLGVVVALFLYVSLTVAFLWRAPTPASAASPGVGGIIIGLERDLQII